MSVSSKCYLEVVSMISNTNNSVAANSFFALKLLAKRILYWSLEGFNEQKLL